jgi:hypothetical protein
MFPYSKESLVNLNYIHDKIDEKDDISSIVEELVNTAKK